MSVPSLHVPARVRQIAGEPNWYDHLDLIRSCLSLGSLAVDASKKPGEQASQLTLTLFTQLLKEGAATLGEAGPNWDVERQAIDTVVVHHTSRPAPMDLSQLNAMHLLNLYVPKYRNPGPDLEIIGGTPVYSGHADQAGRQVFYGYHWLIREDGSRERLLDDAAIGWHSGDWETNARSVAVCFDGDFETGRPPQAALDSAAELIAEQYAGVVSTRILGHNAVVQTVCPGNDFSLWGEELRALVDATRATS